MSSLIPCGAIAGPCRGEHDTQPQEAQQQQRIEKQVRYHGKVPLTRLRKGGILPDFQATKLPAGWRYTTFAMRSWPPSDSLCPSDGSALAAPPESVAVQDAISSARTAGTPDDARGERRRAAQWLSPGANHTSARARPRRGGWRWWHAGAWCDAPDTARVAGAGRGFLLRV